MNYRLASAEYGFVVKRARRIPDGTIIEAQLENPAGGPPFVLRQTASWDRTEYVFRSPPLRGVEAARDYHVVVRLVEATGRELARYTRSFRSEVAQAVLPLRAPVVGPGYQAAPEPASRR